MELGKEEIALIQLDQDLEHMVKVGLIEAYFDSEDNTTWRFRPVDNFQGKCLARLMGARA